MNIGGFFILKLVMSKQLIPTNDVENCCEINYLTDWIEQNINGNKIFVVELNQDIPVLEEKVLRDQLWSFFVTNDDAIDSIVLLQKRGDGNYNYYLFENGIWFTEMCGNGCVAAYKYLKSDKDVTFTSKLWFEVTVHNNGWLYELTFWLLLQKNDALTHLENIWEYGYLDHDFWRFKEMLEGNIHSLLSKHNSLAYRQNNPNKMYELMKRLGVENPISYQVLLSNILRVFWKNNSIKEALQSISIENIMIVWWEPHLIVSIPSIEHKETRDIFIKWLSFLLRFCPVHTPSVDVNNSNTFFFPNQINVMFCEQIDGNTCQIYSAERIFNWSSLWVTGACGTWSTAVWNHFIMNSDDSWNLGEKIIIKNTQGAPYVVWKNTISIPWGNSVIWGEKNDNDNIVNDQLLAPLSRSIREARVHDRSNLHWVEWKWSADDTIANFYSTLPQEIRDLYNVLWNVVDNTGMHETEIDWQEPYKLSAIWGDLFLRNKWKSVFTWYLDTEWLPKWLPVNYELWFMPIKKVKHEIVETINPRVNDSYAKLFTDDEKLFSSWHVYRWTKSFFDKFSETLRNSDSVINKFTLDRIYNDLQKVIDLQVDEYIRINKDNVAFLKNISDIYISWLKEKIPDDIENLKYYLLDIYKNKLKSLYTTYIEQIFSIELLPCLQQEDVKSALVSRVDYFLSLDNNSSQRKVLQRYQNAFLSEFSTITNDFELYQSELSAHNIYDEKSKQFSMKLSSENGILWLYINALSSLLKSDFWKEYIRQVIIQNSKQKQWKDIQIADVYSTGLHTRVSLVASCSEWNPVYYLLYGSEWDKKQLSIAWKVWISEEQVFSLFSWNEENIANNDRLLLKQVSGNIWIWIARLWWWLVEWSERHCYPAAMHAIETTLATLDFSENLKIALRELCNINRITADNGRWYDNLSFDVDWYWSVTNAIDKPIQWTNFPWKLEQYRLFRQQDISWRNDPFSFSLKELLDHPFDRERPSNKDFIINAVFNRINNVSRAWLFDTLWDRFSTEDTVEIAPSDNERTLFLSNIIRSINTKDDKIVDEIKKILLKLVYLSKESGEESEISGDEDIMKILLTNIEKLLEQWSATSNEQLYLQLAWLSVWGYDYSLLQQQYIRSTIAGIDVKLWPAEKSLISEHITTARKKKNIATSLINNFDNNRAYILALEYIAKVIYTTAAEMWFSWMEWIIYSVLVIIQNYELDSDFKTLTDQFLKAKLWWKTWGYTNILDNAIRIQRSQKEEKIQTKKSLIIELKDAIADWELYCFIERIFAADWSAEKRKLLYEILN